MTDTVITCPGGDSVKAGRPSRIRITIHYTGLCNYPQVGVPPESIWVQATPLEGGNVTVWDQPLKIFADDSTDADGNTRVTLPSVSGCGTLRLTVYVDGTAHDSTLVEVRSLDADANGTVTSEDLESVCDLDFDGDIDSHDVTVAGSGCHISDHYDHWHRFALFGTPVRRTNLNRFGGNDPPYGLGDSQSSWSPSGRHIAYTEFIPNGGNVDCRVFRTHSDPREGNDSTAVTTPPSGVHDYDPNWSPLGDEILFDRGDNTAIRKGIPGINANTSERTVVTGCVGGNCRGANMPVFSPNGEWIAYVMKDQRGTYVRNDTVITDFQYQDVWKISVRDTSQKVKLTANRYAFYPQWSPDGKWILFTDNVNGNYRAARVRADYADTTVAPQAVLRPWVGGELGAVLQPVYSPDSLVAAAAHGLSVLTTRVFDPTNTEDSTRVGVLNYPDFALSDQTLYSSQYGYYVQSTAGNTPRWSPDGTRLLMRTSPPDALDELPQLWATRRNMSRPPQITSISGHTVIDSLPVIDVTAMVDAGFTLTPSVTDPEGDQITKGIMFLRTDLGMQNNAGTFGWTPPTGTEDSVYVIKFLATTLSGGSAYALARITVRPDTVGGGGCPVADTWTDRGWVKENTVLGRSMDGASVLDTYRLKRMPDTAGGRYSLRIRENEQEITSLDQATLLVVDHAPGTQVYSVGNSLVQGLSQPVFRVTRPGGKRAMRSDRRVSTLATRTGPSDVTALVGGTSSSGFRGVPGDTLVIERRAPSSISSSSRTFGLPTEGDSTVLVIDGGHKDGRPDSSLVPQGGVPASVDQTILEHTGILVQAMTTGGSWQTTAHLYPREGFDETATRVPAGSPVRLVFLGRHTVRYVGELESSAPIVADTLALLAAHHSRVGDVLPLLRAVDNRIVTITPGDTVNLEFAERALAKGAERSLFLCSSGVYTSLSKGLSAIAPAWHNALGLPRPNPSVRTVAFNLTTSGGPVTLRIFDVAGRLIRTLVERSLPAGPLEAAWDLRGEEGRRVPRGVYFCRMVAGGWKAQHPVVVLTP